MRSVTVAQLQKRVALNTRRLRLDRGLTQVGSAKLASLFARHWQKVEAAHANITLDTICKVARALGVDPADLLQVPPR